MDNFSHIDKNGSSKMVDVSSKEDTLRIAIATSKIKMNPKTFDAIYTGAIKKGNVLEVAKIAGIQAAKKTSELIPMCHPIRITNIEITFLPDKEHSEIKITAKVSALDKTGAEMESLIAASVCALTIYDMCKAIDKEMIISDINLLEKTGGKSGDFRRGEIIP